MIFFLCQLRDFFFHLTVLSSEINREKILTKWAFQRFCKKKRQKVSAHRLTVPNSVNSITVNFRYNMNFDLSSFQHFFGKRKRIWAEWLLQCGGHGLFFFTIVKLFLTINDVCFKNAPRRVWFSDYCLIVTPH